MTDVWKKRAMITLDQLTEVATTILEAKPDPVVRLRLLRDVLKRPPEAREVEAAAQDLATSRWVQALEREQWADGSWGRFHTEDTTIRQRIATTEVGVSRAIALGLDAAHPILEKAGEYITGVLEGTRVWRDRREVSWGQRWWDASVRLISAATLAQIQPQHPILEEVWKTWSIILQRAFPLGHYQRDREIQAHLELLNLKDLSTYARKAIKERHALNCFTKYHVALLGTRAHRLPPQLEAAYVATVWTQGIGYIGVPAATVPARLVEKTPSHVEAWLASIEVLTLFPSWDIHAKEPVEWLWTHRNEEGLWDFGARSTRSTYFPLSESWRRKGNRTYDWTTRVLVLLRQYHDRTHQPTST